MMGKHVWWGHVLQVSVHGTRCARQGVHAWQEACMAGGMWSRGHAWQGVCGKEACMAGETATVADGTHVTGMHSWFNRLTETYYFTIKSSLFKNIFVDNSSMGIGFNSQSGVVHLSFSRKAILPDLSDLTNIKCYFKPLLQFNCYR